MITIPFKPVSLSENESLKMNAASKQIRDLISRLSEGVKYRVLTKEDRKTLIGEGYAPDLINNIIYLTQRVAKKGLGTSEYCDSLSVGFTYAAFDPSIYASSTIKNNLITLSRGRCCFCETDLQAGRSGVVLHFRPSSVIIRDGLVACSEYYSLAYQQSNLIYTCHACGEVCKSSRFPVTDSRFPNTSLDKENYLLINPYFEDPRTFIRFNPLNAEVFAFDQVVDFFGDEFDFNSGEVEKKLWEKPTMIPNQKDSDGHCISDPENDKRFAKWLSKRCHSNYRGQETINVLCLNRAELVISRWRHLVSSYDSFKNYCSTLSPTDNVDMNSFLNLPQIQSGYSSMLVDATNCWDKSSKLKPTKSTSDEPPTDWHTLYTRTIDEGNKKQAHHVTSYVPDWILSSLMYVVFESELSVSKKRRLVYLNANDKLYGGDIFEKCIFLSIDWLKDFELPLKVRNNRHTWETSFEELATSRPLEIIELFTHNELWAEGDFPALN